MMKLRRNAKLARLYEPRKSRDEAERIELPDSQYADFSVIIDRLLKTTVPEAVLADSCT